MWKIGHSTALWNRNSAGSREWTRDTSYKAGAETGWTGCHSSVGRWEHRSIQPPEDRDAEWIPGSQAGIGKQRDRNRTEDKKVEVEGKEGVKNEKNKDG